ncbi:MAG: hypothetical protein HY017_32275 [Betaproteobacteria bacterium]|nr:hypothetical protein [Betaproteobacteria bacterium]
MPIVNVAEIGRIEFPDSMTREQIDAAVKNDILPLFRQRASGATSPDAVAALAQPSMGPNPFSKGTARADINYRIGDRYRYRQLDVLTRIESRRFDRIITAISDTEVTFNNGNFITDLFNNTIADNRRGQTFTDRQIYVAEYSLGRKWTTTYRGTRRDLVPDVWTVALKVVARESITVPAGTFDAFKVEGSGYTSDHGGRVQITYWIAPEKVRLAVASEYVGSTRGGRRLATTDRYELVSFKQAG